MLVIIIISLVFAFFMFFGYQHLLETINKNLDRAEALPFFEIGTDNASMRAERDICAILCHDEKNYRASSLGFCSGQTIGAIVKASYLQEEGRIKTDTNYYSYRRKPFDESETLSIVYVYDFTDDYIEYRNNNTILIMGHVIGAVLVILIIVLYNKRNLLPFKNSFEKQKQLIANASHELKTPITILSTQLSVLEDDAKVGAEQAVWLANMREQTERMGHLVNEMLELARFEAIHPVDMFRLFDFSDLVTKVTLASEVLAFEGNKMIESNIEPNLYIFADPDGMEKVLYTLLENALKYTPENGNISISLTTEKHYVILKIRNTGVGIARKDMPNLFERFFRGDESHHSSDNFGLGLAIARAIVESNKGSIGVDSDGSTYTEFAVIMKRKSNKHR